MRAVCHPYHILLSGSLFSYTSYVSLLLQTAVAFQLIKAMEVYLCLVGVGYACKTGKGFEPKSGARIQ